MVAGEEQTPYQALYRRFRPQRFADVLGQGHVTRALQAAVRDGKVAHAYLFSGPRGTGKTSTARILAMALNCENPSDGEPCGECRSCLAIRSGSSLDVQELDSATNRGIDEMRDLLSRVALGTPGRWKVYIVDEVHQITPAAASALLKTLEEPPGHVIFVLATTDPQKVLDTIRSRTQHFEFRLLGTDVLAGLLTDVAHQASIDLSPEAIDVVVRRGHGSARDALSALDQVAAAGTVEDDSRLVTGLVDALIERDAGSVLVKVAEAAQSGLDARRLGTELLEHLRNGFLATRARSLVLLSEEGVAEVEEQAAKLGAAALVRAMELIGQALIDMRDAADPRTTLEVALVRLAAPEVDDSRAALLERIERLERAPAGTGPRPAPAASGQVGAGPPAPLAVSPSAPVAAGAGPVVAGPSAGAAGARRPPAASSSSSASSGAASGVSPAARPERVRPNEAGSFGAAPAVPGRGGGGSPGAAGRGDGGAPAAPGGEGGGAPGVPGPVDGGAPAPRGAGPVGESTVVPAGDGLSGDGLSGGGGSGGGGSGAGRSGDGRSGDGRATAGGGEVSGGGGGRASAGGGGEAVSGGGSAAGRGGGISGEVSAGEVAPRLVDTSAGGPPPVGAAPAPRPVTAPPAPRSVPDPPGPPPAAGSRAPSREELTMAWGDGVLPSLRPAVKVYVANGRFLASTDDTAVYAVPDQGLLSRAEGNRAEVEHALSSHFGRPVRLRLVLDGDAKPVAGRGAVAPTPSPPPEPEPEDDWAEMIEAPAAVTSPEQRLLDAFPGAEEVQ